MLDDTPVIVYCSSSNAKCRQGDQASSVVIFHIDYCSVCNMYISLAFQELLYRVVILCLIVNIPLKI